MPLPAYDRWERQLNARGGYQKKRSGRYTKPGPRPRALRLVPPVQPTYVDPEPVNRIWSPYRVDPGGTLTTNSVYDTTSNWIWTTDTTTSTAATATWVNTTGNGVWTDTTTTGTGTWVYDGTNYDYHDSWSVEAHPMPNLTPEQKEAIKREERRARFRARIRAQIEGGAPNIYDQRRRVDFSQVSQPEIVALQLLKKMLSEDDWKRYLRYGFIIVSSPITGLDYQIYRGGGHIIVLRRGQRLAELCIHVSGAKCPPTDRVIGKKIMLEATELDVWHKSNVHACQEARNWKYRRPKIEDLVALGGGGLAHDIRAKAANEDHQVIFTPDQVRRSMEPIYTIGNQRAQEFVVTSGYLQTA